MKIIKIIITIFTALSLASCSYRPILDQNEKYYQVGEKKAESDIDACKKNADDYLKKYKASRAGKEAVRSGIWGTLIGAGLGLFLGHSLKSAGVGAAIGAPSGAVLGGGGVLAEDEIKPDQIKQRYITNCLARQGYSVIGWE
jgi:uncharacterized protein YcfJ